MTIQKKDIVISIDEKYIFCINAGEYGNYAMPFSMDWPLLVAAHANDYAIEHYLLDINIISKSHGLDISDLRNFFESSFTHKKLIQLVEALLEVT